MTLYEYIMLNHNTIDIFGKYCGIWRTWALFWGHKKVQKGVKMFIIGICYSFTMPDLPIS